MASDYVLWKLDISRAIALLPDIEFQLSCCWVGATSDGGSFREAMSYLYSDYQLANFLTLRAWEKAGLKEAAAAELLTLKVMLDAYDEPDTDASILADPGWHTILAQAKKVMGLLEQ